MADIKTRDAVKGTIKTIITHPEGVDLLPSNIELSGMETGLFKAKQGKKHG